MQVFADQYPYEASSTSLRAALAARRDRVAGNRRCGGDADAEKKAARQTLEAMVRENMRRRGGASAIQIAFFRPIRRSRARPLRRSRTARKVAPEMPRIDMMMKGERLDRLLQHVGRRTFATS